MAGDYVSRWTAVCLSVHPSICQSNVHLSVRILFPDDNFNGFSPNLVCALMLLRSGLGLLMGNFIKNMMELSAHIFISGRYLE